MNEYRICYFSWFGFPWEKYLCNVCIYLLAQGQTQGSSLTVHQQALTTGPFGNTCEADAVSPKVAIGGCKTHVSTTRGNASGSKATTHNNLVILTKHKPTSHSYIQI
jgi:hypothetical protein